MAPFNYGECDMCKLHQSRKRDVMLDVLPVDICRRLVNILVAGGVKI